MIQTPTQIASQGLLAVADLGKKLNIKLGANASMEIDDYLYGSLAGTIL